MTDDGGGQISLNRNQSTIHNSGTRRDFNKMSSNVMKNCIHLCYELNMF